MKKHYRVKEEIKTAHKIKRRKAKCIGHTSRRNCLLKHVIEVKIQGTGRRGRRHKQVPDDHKERRRYWKLKDKALPEELALEEAMDLS